MSPPLFCIPIMVNHPALNADIYLNISRPPIFIGGLSLSYTIPSHSPYYATGPCSPGLPAIYLPIPCNAGPYTSTVQYQYTPFWPIIRVTTYTGPCSFSLTASYLLIPCNAGLYPFNLPFTCPYCAMLVPTNTVSSWTSYTPSRASTSCQYLPHRPLTTHAVQCRSQPKYCTIPAFSSPRYLLIPCNAGPYQCTLPSRTPPTPSGPHPYASIYPTASPCGLCPCLYIVIYVFGEFNGPIGLVSYITLYVPIGR